MALTKTRSRYGYEAGYHALVRIDSLDFFTREACFVFALWKDKAARRAGVEPVVPVAGKLRLRGAKFDAYFGKGVTGRNDILAQAYAAAKAEGLDSWDGPLSLADAADDTAD